MAMENITDPYRFLDPRPKHERLKLKEVGLQIGMVDQGRTNNDELIINLDNLVETLEDIMN